MKSYLEIRLDGRVIARFDRHMRLPGKQRAYLDKLDLDMDRGIHLGPGEVASPTVEQRGHYVAMHLLKAVESGNEAMSAAMGAYLVHRLPALEAVDFKHSGDDITTHLNFPKGHH